MPKPESWDKRQLIWRHNGFKGSAKMMQAQCRSMIRSKTTTAKTVELATQIEHLAVELEESLKQRVGP